MQALFSIVISMMFAWFRLSFCLDDIDVVLRMKIGLQNYVSIPALCSVISGFDDVFIVSSSVAVIVSVLAVVFGLYTVLSSNCLKKL